jgi:hypothetical protein
MPGIYAFDDEGTKIELLETKTIERGKIIWKTVRAGENGVAEMDPSHCATCILKISHPS